MPIIHIASHPMKQNLYSEDHKDVRTIDECASRSGQHVEEIRFVVNVFFKPNQKSIFHPKTIPNETVNLETACRQASDWLVLPPFRMTLP